MPAQIAPIDQLREELKEQWREEIVEHVEHILTRVVKRIYTSHGSGSALLVAQAIADVLAHEDR